MHGGLAGEVDFLYLTDVLQAAVGFGFDVGVFDAGERALDW